MSAPWPVKTNLRSLTDIGASAVPTTLTRRALFDRGLRGLLGASICAVLAPAINCGSQHQRLAPKPPPDTELETPLPDSAASPNVPAKPPGPTTPNEVVIDVIGNVSDIDVQQAVNAAELARDFYYRELGFYVDGPVHLSLVDLPSLPIFGDTYLRANQRISSITINVGSAAWIIGTPTQRDEVVAHEYFHVVQDWLHGESVTRPELFFLVEGGAECAGYAAMIDAGRMTYPEFVNGLFERLRSEQVLPQPLEDLTPDEERAWPAYALAALAVDSLIANRGLERLAHYFLLTATQHPELAFEGAFGTPLASFYTEFAKWRTTQGI